MHYLFKAFYFVTLCVFAQVASQAEPIAQVALAAQANAQTDKVLPLNLCNETSYVLDVALAQQIGAASRSWGWIRIMPGVCKQTKLNIEKGGQAYVYAQSIDTHAGAVQRFTGNERFCVQGEREFAIESRRECHQRGYRLAEFKPTNISKTKHVVYFTDPLDFGPKRALIAGAQRLLSDIGYQPGRIDGFMGRRSRNALADFQKKHNMRINYKITQPLLQKLLIEAEKTSTERGLQLCNKTPDLIWAALGEISADDFITQGWLRIDIGKCVRAINVVLRDRYYFVYAEAVDKNGTLIVRDGQRKIWSGDVSLCTKPPRFTIKEHDDCSTRGLDETHFIKIDTGKQTKWVHNFE